MDICSRFTGYENNGDHVLIFTDTCDIKIYFMTDELVRIRASFDKLFEEESYILTATAWEDRLDGVLGSERVRINAVTPSISEDEGRLVLSTNAVTLEINKEPFGIKLMDASGVTLFATLPGMSFVKDSNDRVMSYTLMKEDDCYYGFGEKTGLINKNKSFIRERATDAMGYDPMKMDTLYKHIPFYIRLDRENGRSCGVFYNNFYESVFNMGCEKSNYWPRYSYFQADGGDLDIFLIPGTIKHIVERYTFLTGRPLLLPKRGMGYQGSSMYYPELPKDSDDAVLSFVDTVKEEGFPIDGFHLSSGYTNHDGKRYVFTWNKERFKDPEGFFALMNEKGAQNVPNIKPGILLQHPYFKDFLEKDVFVHDSKDPSTFAKGIWWGGIGAFWDFTSERGRKLWKKYMTDSLISVGTNSIWNDNCEYDSIADKDSTCDFEGKGGTIGALKPFMSLLMCRIAGEAVIEHDENVRPYVVSRAGCSGIQRYAQTWCGDNYTSWETLKYNIPTILGMGLCGQPNEGSDIGGFAGPAPSEELFVRWVQNGIFQPRFSIHSASNDNTVTEPWMYRDSADIIKDAMLMRYRFTPYLYSYEYEATVSGAPILRPLVYEFQSDAACLEESFEYMFGKDLLIANVLEEGQTNLSVYLPAGSKWYDYNNNFKCYEGGKTISVPVNIRSIPMFVREGAIIPTADDQLMSMERDHTKSLHLLIAPNTDRGAETEKTSHFTIYDDDGVSNDYKKGIYHITNIDVSSGEQVVMDVAHEGSYKDWVSSITAEIIAKEKAPYWVSLNGRQLKHFLNRRYFNQAEEGWYYSQSKRAVLVKYANTCGNHRLIVSFEQFDLIGM